MVLWEEPRYVYLDALVVEEHAYLKIRRPVGVMMGQSTFLSNSMTFVSNSISFLFRGS